MKRYPTSASNISRRRDCPGSGILEAGLAEQESEFSAEGTMLHRLFLTGERPHQLTPDQHEALDVADFYANEFFGNLRQQFEIPMNARFIDEREPSLMLHDAKGKPLFPGHADVIRTWPEYDVRGIVDAKFGFMEVPHAADNLQLASYAAMRQQQSPAKALGVAITQPRNFGPRFTQAIYTADQIPAATVELTKIFHACQMESAPRVAGERQCHFCKAKTICPEYKATFMGIEPATSTIAVQTLSNDELERVHIAIAFANKIAPDVRDEMRSRIEARALPGWKLQNSGDTVTLDDTLGLYNALRDYFQGLSPEAAETFTPAAFDDCRRIEWGKLVKLVQRITRLGENKAKEFVVDIGAPFTSRVPIAKRIVRDKEAKLLK